MNCRRIILASASPRRRELLSLVVDSFDVLPSGFDESEVPEDLPPDKHVVYSATMKARDVSADNPSAVVIGADTIVVVKETILGKPDGEAGASAMLKTLGGRTHQVYTGLAVCVDGAEHTACESTDVTFRDLSCELISRYVATGEPMDKAGAYAIQGKGAMLVRSLNGCYTNVVGLPLYALCTLLEQSGVPILPK